MKRYVHGYWLRDTDPEASRFENLEVAYADDPSWKIPFPHEAEYERGFLENSRVHVGEHYCAFSVEELPEGQFAIVCITHPEGRSATGENHTTPNTTSAHDNSR